MTLDTDHLTIRFSRPDDDPQISRLAQLESVRPPHGPLLVAEVAGELHAALPLDGGAAVADPFRHTRDLLRLLEVRRRQLRRTTAARRWPLRRHALTLVAPAAPRSPS